MKKVLFPFLLAMAFRPVAFANDVVPGNSAAVEAVFNQVFKDVHDLKWYVQENEYTARFTRNDLPVQITYDQKGKFIRSRRVFGEESLPLNILSKIKEKYEGKTIKVVIEITEVDSLVYSIVVEDDKNIWMLEAKPGGNLHLAQKLKKQQGIE